MGDELGKEKAKAELQRKLNLAAVKQREFFIKTPNSENSPFWINFELEGWAPNPHLINHNIIRDIELNVTVSGVQETIVVDVLVKTFNTPKDEFANYGYLMM